MHDEQLEPQERKQSAFELNASTTLLMAGDDAMTMARDKAAAMELDKPPATSNDVKEVTQPE